jgi:nicotinamide-nucleotide amidase
MFPASLVEKASFLLDTCRGKGLWLATAESCTGGLVGALLTSVAGSSDVYERGFITYTNEAKHELLGVGQEPLRQFGAVSAVVAEQMARGALTHSRADCAVSITGIAGPGGGSPGKPVGLVWFGVAARYGSGHSTERRFGDVGRQEVRLAAVATAIDLLIEAAHSLPVNQVPRP